MYIYIFSLLSSPFPLFSYNFPILFIFFLSFPSLFLICFLSCSSPLLILFLSGSLRLRIQIIYNHMTSFKIQQNHTNYTPIKGLLAGPRSHGMLRGILLGILRVYFWVYIWSLFRFCFLGPLGRMSVFILGHLGPDVDFCF